MNQVTEPQKITAVQIPHCRQLDLCLQRRLQFHYNSVNERWNSSTNIPKAPKLFSLFSWIWIPLTKPRDEYLYKVYNVNNSPLLLNSQSIKIKMNMVVLLLLDRRPNANFISWAKSPCLVRADEFGLLLSEYNCIVHGDSHL